MEDKQVKKIPKSKLDKARKIIESATWIFAKTYSDKAPHEYCLRTTMKNGDVSVDDMLFLANLVRDYGYKEKYDNRYVQTYVNIDGYKYWSMDPTPKRTDLINRVQLNPAEVEEMVRLWKDGFA
jgi:hypothetical protein